MNRDQLKKTKYYRVRLRPIALRTDGAALLPEMDDDWFIDGVDERGVQLNNQRTSHTVILAYDQIREFMSDVKRDRGGLKHGFFNLKVQLTLTPKDVQVEPIWK